VTNIRVKSYQNEPVSNDEIIALTDTFQHLWNKIDREREEKEKLQREIASHAPEGRNYTNEQYVNLLQQREILIEGLRFYTDEDHYSGFGEAWILPDRGKTAREALKQIGIEP
jgi:hypothetical protein